MKTLITLATSAGKKLYGKSFHGPDHDKLARFYSPGQEVEIVCSTDEMEEFEADGGVVLASDVIESASEFIAFANWLAANYKLKAI